MLRVIQLLCRRTKNNPVLIGEAGVGKTAIVEGLAHLDRISKQQVQFIALPLKIVNGDGSPVRAVAIEESSENGIGLGEARLT